MGAFEDGSTFVTGVFAKLPEALRAQVQEALSKPEAKDAITLIGESVMARSDYSKNMDTLKTEREKVEARFTELNEWYSRNQAALQDYVAHKAEIDRLKARRPGADDDDDLPPDDKAKPQPDIRQVAVDVVNRAAPEYIAVSAWLAAKTDQHRALFGEALDTLALVRHPKLGKDIPGQPGRVYSLDDVYAEVHGERVQQKQQEAETKRINDEVEKRLTEERKKLFTQQPFPLRGATEPSVLDTLATKEGVASHTLDSAVAEYERLQATRNGAPA